VDCKKCGSNSKVTSTIKHDLSVLRERKCLGCGRRWYTEECENNNVGFTMYTVKRERYVLDKEV